MTRGLAKVPAGQLVAVNVQLVAPSVLKASVAHGAQAFWGSHRERVPEYVPAGQDAAVKAQAVAPAALNAVPVQGRHAAAPLANVPAGHDAAV